MGCATSAPPPPLPTIEPERPRSAPKIPAPPAELRFTVTELARGTNNFSSSLVLGEGGFGKCYKGYVRQQQVAIKALDRLGQQGEAQFTSELQLLRRLQHPRVLKHLGICTEGQHRALVFPLMAGGSLRWALDTNKLSASSEGPACSQRLVLTWAARLHIAAQVADGLAYLHQEGVIHRDLTSSNVLLDAINQAKLCDFGFSLCQEVGPSGRPQTPQAQDANVMTLTVGYAAPEYIAQGAVSAHSDTYAFGVLLLELLTGLQPMLGGSHQKSLVEHMLPHLSELNALQEMLDPHLDRRLVVAEQLALVAEVAQACLQLEPSHRPRAREAHRLLAAACKFKGAPIQLPPSPPQQQQQHHPASPSSRPHTPHSPATAPAPVSPAAANPFTDHSFLGLAQAGFVPDQRPALASSLLDQGTPASIDLLSLDPMPWGPQSPTLSGSHHSHSPSWAAGRCHSSMSESANRWQPGQDLLA